MKKIIRTTEGNLELSLEEVTERYENMVKQFAHKCVNSFGKVDSNVYDFNDYLQMGRMDLIAAYRCYDTDKSCFSTYLTRTLNNRIAYYSKFFDFEIRKSGKLEYLNKTLSNDSEIEFLETLNFSKKDKYFEEERTSLEKFLLESLDAEEKEMLTVEFCKKTKTLDLAEKVSCEYCVELFGGNDNLKNYSITKREYAIHKNISRPTLNNRINKILKKTRKLTREFQENNYKENIL